MNLQYSFIIPVYNRPDEIEELLESFASLRSVRPYEIVVVEDGSTVPCYEVVHKYNGLLDIAYYATQNSGPGASRNFGMTKARGDYFVILDSDCILPPDYLNVVENELSKSYVDFFGGPDAAMDSFSAIQKAINYAMTSFLTTGGIRGAKTKVSTFQPRSFNMGLSRRAFEQSQGFGKIHPGEDPDLVLRLWKLGFKSRLFPEAFVFHKRRISWSKFYTQVNKFGLVRPILNIWHKGSSKITYWFPTVFIVGFCISFLLLLAGFRFALICYSIYLMVVMTHALIKTRSFRVSCLSLIAIFIQFFGYGYGFLKSTLYIVWLKRNPQKQFPKLFFD